MKTYYYDRGDTQFLYTDSQLLRPFLCPANATPLKFESSEECLEFLEENNIEGTVAYKVRSYSSYQI